MEKLIKILALLAVTLASLAVGATQILDYLHPVGLYQIIGDQTSAYILDTTTGYAEYFVYDGEEFQFRGQFQHGATAEDSDTEGLQIQKL